MKFNRYPHLSRSNNRMFLGIYGFTWKLNSVNRYSKLTTSQSYHHIPYAFCHHPCYPQPFTKPRTGSWSCLSRGSFAWVWLYPLLEGSRLGKEIATNGYNVIELSKVLGKVSKFPWNATLNIFISWKFHRTPDRMILFFSIYQVFGGSRSLKQIRCQQTPPHGGAPSRIDRRN